MCLWHEGEAFRGVGFVQNTQKGVVGAGLEKMGYIQYLTSGHLQETKSI